MITYKSKKKKLNNPLLSKEEINNIGNSIKKGLTDLDKRLKKKK